MAIPTPSERVHFGVFEADLRSGELHKHGVKIKLHPQPFQVLAMLLEHPGEVVTREELKTKLWPLDTFVDFDVGLNSAIKKLRDALGDSAEIPRYVETLPRRGYRFIGSLSDASTSKAEPRPAVAESAVEKHSSAANEGVVTGVSAVSGARRRWVHWAMAGAAVALLVLLAGLSARDWRLRLWATAAPVHIRSLAVLPLENLSGDPAQEYFADGMTEAVTTDLGRIGGLGDLRVISRTSTMQYKGVKKTVPEIARELNVDAVVEGAVLRSGDRVRVTAQLIQATPEKHLWADSYERDLRDILALQSEVAQAIAASVHVKLTPQEQARLARTQSVDPQAYEFYLKGCYFWDKYTDAAARKSIDYFQQAIQRDPNYALAYAGLADAYNSRNDLSPEEQYSKAKAMARKALEMDEGLAEAHAALAFSMFAYDWDWAGAEKEFQRALALNPNYAWAHQWYGIFQHAMGRPNWAAENKRAHELEPLSLLIGAGGAWYVQQGQPDLAIELIRKKLELDPNFAFGYVRLGGLYRSKAMYEQSIAEIKKGLSLSGGQPEFLKDLGITYAESGRRLEALETVKQLVQLSKRRYVSPLDVAWVYAALGEKDLAFDWLQKALADRSFGLQFLKVSKTFDSLRSDPRFGELVRRVGLPQ